MSIQGKRMAIVTTALNEVGNSEPKKYYLGVVKGIVSGHLDWCGIFGLWVYHQNGILTDVTWHFGDDTNHDGHPEFGFLMVPPKALPMTNTPEPGDIAYFNRKQHHAVVEAVQINEISLINGNGLGGKVTRSTTHRQAVTAFFSIAPYLKDSVFPENIS